MPFSNQLFSYTIPALMGFENATKSGGGTMYPYLLTFQSCYVGESPLTKLAKGEILRKRCFLT